MGVLISLLLTHVQRLGSPVDPQAVIVRRRDSASEVMPRRPFVSETGRTVSPLV
jgi:hypothetical protein